MSVDRSAFELGPDDPGRGIGLGPGVALRRVGPDQRLEAAVRLVGDQTDDPYLAGQRFLASAEELGIDLGRMWATMSGGVGRNEAREPGGVSGEVVRQVALAVPGSGRTAMLFVSGPMRRRRGSGLGATPLSELGSGPVPVRERVAVIRAACAEVASGDSEHPGSVLAQALMEPREKEAVVAFAAAGFTQIGDLAYMRRVGPPPRAEEGGLGAEVRLVSTARLAEEGRSAGEIERLVITALERSYVDTLDCPELCGLRRVEDVLESHRQVGLFDPSMWWLIMAGDEPEGCLLMNVCPEHESVELVYLGIAPGLRGRGLGSRVLGMGLRHVLGAEVIGGSAEAGAARCVVGSGGVTCAVDTRNGPAMRLYRGAGFQRFAVRVPLVMPLTR